ncbi:Bifunctional purine biosynthesis protein PurH [Frankliniella fusca]|uniref:Bifunctional purine biosynthesis protein PurH n=2 Tax=Frankliniella fusca TaxID=407009 RepID=A0AAE1GQW6_9NEOP|nr:Bifunctional purine biosynthesis protein PurH [Frankliniella fusca]
MTIIKWMRKKLWRLEKFENESMRTGIRLESTARKKCESLLKEHVNQNYTIKETGLWKNPKFPQMACSPDGLITLPGEQTKLLEIKVLTVLNQTSGEEICNSEEEDNPEGDNPQEEENNPQKAKTNKKKLQPVNPEKFEEEMTPEQKRRFYLKRNNEGDVVLKTSHAYNYQIQMSLNILELSECILCVFSETGCRLVTVEYDQSFWEEKRERLLQKHREILIPEAILGKTKRWLPPCELIYSKFHEDPEDPYFENDS